MLSEPSLEVLARPHTEPWVSDRGHTDEQFRCSASLRQAAVAQKLQSYLQLDFFYLLFGVQSFYL